MSLILSKDARRGGEGCNCRMLILAFLSGWFGEKWLPGYDPPESLIVAMVLWLDILTAKGVPPALPGRQ